jgi:nicotinamidase/pyrazinamidase
MSKNVQLVVIDPQVDFCAPDGNLYVQGADQDMARLAAMIKRLGDKLDDIHITLDSHHKVHIAHPIFWKDTAGRHPNPFTIITAAEVRDGVWTTSRPSLHRLGLNYVEQLEKNGRYPLCIWPPHCLIGSSGAAIYGPIFDATQAWITAQNIATIDFVTKGSNPFTEHYSAIQADVPDPKDPGTQINVNFLRTIDEADIILLAGEAGSHCLANTGLDIVNYFPNKQAIASKIVLLTDATSPVPGFEKNQNDFINQMTSLGMQTTTTVDFLA